MGLTVAAPADMCSLVKTVGRGGAMKNSRYACYCCTIHRDDLAKPNQQLCEDCLAEGNSMCYHQDISDEDLLDRLEAEQADLLRQWPHLHNMPYKESTIRFGASGIGDALTDPKHIEFQPRNHVERIRYVDLLRKELTLRNLIAPRVPLDAMR